MRRGSWPGSITRRVARRPRSTCWSALAMSTNSWRQLPIWLTWRSRSPLSVPLSPQVNHPEVPMRSIRNLILVVGAALAMACSDNPTDPSASPSFGLAGQDQTRHEQLKQLLQAEKERIKQERDNGKIVYAVARAEGKLDGDQLKRAKKLGSTATDLLRCEPRPLEGDAAIIGPDGGTLQIGEHQLVIPRGALTEEQVIVGKAPTSPLVDVQFEPEGLQFQQPAQLTLSYKGCDVPTGDLLVAYLGIGNRILELPVSHDYRSYSEVTGEIHHFSRY